MLIKSKGKKSEEVDNFIAKESDDYSVVIEARYYGVYIPYNGEIILTKLRKNINLVCN